MLFSRRHLLSALACAPLAGCGFRLRGHYSLPFESIYLDMNRNTPLAADIVRYLRGGTSVSIVSDPAQAQAVLKLVDTKRTRSVVSLNADGLAREFELNLTLTFRLLSATGQEYLPATALSVTRDIIYDDSEYLSREKEESVLFAQMQSDIVSQLMRLIEKVPATPQAH